MADKLAKLLGAHASHQRGIYSVCSAHPLVLEAAMRQALEDGGPLLIEATCNQVNQFGGYTGMTPAQFRAFVEEAADAVDLPRDRLILGGDHLGPNPWRHLGAAEAMNHAVDMVRAFAAAGFRKLHLDASMSCADDPALLADTEKAARAARMCAAAEGAVAHPDFVYVIGTEVPVPGGATEALAAIDVTRPEAALDTIEMHQRVFVEQGLATAWDRVIALVVQPGVEFDHQAVVDYEAENARQLVAIRHDRTDLVFEAHSTDYQRTESLHELVRDGFAILKVGPALTFALREGLMSLSGIEAALVPESEQARLFDIVEQDMLAHPADWQGHYHGSVAETAVLRRYSFSDRIRYYWNRPPIREAVGRLTVNLEHRVIPVNLLSQFLPIQYERARRRALRLEPRELLIDKVRDVLRSYSSACRSG